jgi:tRNA(Arg) A34 adenosine deaminase TadA
MKWGYSASSISIALMALVFAMPSIAFPEMHSMQGVTNESQIKVDPCATPNLAENTSPRSDVRSKIASVEEERARLFMLAALSYTYAGLGATPPIGYDISAVIAWGIGNPNETPKFLIERNRNYQKQGEVFHAEANAIRSAYDKMRDFDISPTTAGQEILTHFADDFKDATLYTTLEPCPMCETTITMAKIPLAVYCMEDPGLREIAAPHETKSCLVVPKKFYNRELREEPSRLLACRDANLAMWTAVQTNQTATFEITNYLSAHGKTIFGPAWNELGCLKVRYSENQQLLLALQKATGAASCTTR